MVASVQVQGFEPAALIVLLSKREAVYPAPAEKPMVLVKPVTALSAADPDTAATTPEITPEEPVLVRAIEMAFAPVPGAGIRAGKFEVSGAALLVPEISRT